MKDRLGNILYIGKSKCLRKRLASYFQSHSRSGHIARLVKQVAQIEVMLVNTETESLLLENTLIARHRPAFNRLMWRADKGYPNLVLSDEQYPRLVPYQAGHPNKELGGAGIRARFGPFLSHRFCLGVLDFARDQFQLRTCQPLPREVCLRYHLQQCSGICEAKITGDRYAQDVDAASRFLSSRPAEWVAQIRSQMWKHAENLAFERSQQLKELVSILEGALERQLVEREVDHDQFFVYLAERGALIACVERGSLVGMDYIASDPAKGGSIRLNDWIRERITPESCGEVIVNRNHGLELGVKELGANWSVRGAQSETERAYLQLCKLNYDYRSEGEIVRG